MIIRKVLLASTAIATVAAFENDGPGWKMDGDKLALDGDGNPIYVDANGREMSVKHDTISNLNREAKTHREAKEAAETALAKYKDITDPAAAVAALETVKNIDAKKLIDAGEVEKVKTDIRNEFTTQLSEKDNALAAAQQKIDNMLIDSVFNSSEFINERVAVPRDFFQAAMRNNFKVEDGKVVAYDPAGNRLMSKKTVGEYASPNEALELLVEAHPQKDVILKAPDASGSGGNGNGGNRGSGRFMKRSDFDALPPMKQAEAASAAGKGELTITD